jgi:hypothetical protein
MSREVLPHCLTAPSCNRRRGVSLLCGGLGRVLLFRIRLPRVLDARADPYSGIRVRSTAFLSRRRLPLRCRQCPARRCHLRSGIESSARCLRVAEFLRQPPGVARNVAVAQSAPDNAPCVSTLGNLLFLPLTRHRRDLFLSVSGERRVGAALAAVRTSGRSPPHQFGRHLFQPISRRRTRWQFESTTTDFGIGITDDEHLKICYF